MSVPIRKFEPKADTVPTSTAIPEQVAEEKENRPPLSSLRVDHSATVGLSWGEIEALRPPIIIEGFLRQGEVLLLGAESKSRKSWLAQDAGMSVALGMPWLPIEGEDDETGFQTGKATVRVLDLELAESEVAYRFAKARGNRLADDLERQEQASKNYLSYSLEGESAIGILAYVDELEAEVQAGDLVIVDCLYRLQADGNETEEVARIFERLKRFAKRTKAGVILVDHFRKAGADKARDRFAGTFVKQASASTLVAIEAKGEDILAMSIDARTFHGMKQVHARFDLASYCFHQVPEEDVKAAKEAKTKAEQEAQLVQIWRSKNLETLVTVAEAKERWSVYKNISRQAATTRLEKLTKAGFLEIAEAGAGKATKWQLIAYGREVLTRNLHLHPTLHHEQKP